MPQTVFTTIFASDSITQLRPVTLHPTVFTLLHATVLTSKCSPSYAAYYGIHSSARYGIHIQRYRVVLQCSLHFRRYHLKTLRCFLQNGSSDATAFARHGTPFRRYRFRLPTLSLPPPDAIASAPLFLLAPRSPHHATPPTHSVPSWHTG